MPPHVTTPTHVRVGGRIFLVVIYRLSNITTIIDDKYCITSRKRNLHLNLLKEKVKLGIIPDSVSVSCNF